MNDSSLEPSERLRATLRAAIAEMELRVAELLAQPGGTSSIDRVGKVGSSWRKLVPLIAPEPEPERRSCPHCQKRIALAATRCMYCLKKSIPAPVER